jgi:hypothetical protein
MLYKVVQPTVVLAIFAFASGTGVAETSNQDNGILKGNYSVSTQGTAEIGDPTSGKCVVNDLTAANLSGIWVFDGKGGISYQGGGTFGTLSIGATTCPRLYTQIGTYNVTVVGAGIFRAEGTISIPIGSSQASGKCKGTQLTNVYFTLNGQQSGGSWVIQTFGGGDESTYAEGPVRGATTCQAPILNFSTGGTGERLN